MPRAGQEKKRISPAIAALLIVQIGWTAGCEQSASCAADGEDYSGTDDTDTELDTGQEDLDGPPIAGDSDDFCDTQSEAVFVFTSQDSLSIADPALARFLIEHERPVFPTVRPREFLNYYDFGYQPDGEGKLRVDARLRELDDEGAFDLQIGVVAPQMTAHERRPLNLTIAVDTSESMSTAPIQRAKQCCVAIAGSLRAGDTVSLVSWNAEQPVLLETHTVSGASDAILVGHCNALAAGGSTDPHAGLSRAYDLAEDAFSPERADRVILLSDGGANVDPAELDRIEIAAEDDGDGSILLVAAGIGDEADPTCYDDASMRRVAAAGGGPYLFVDSAEEAAFAFGPSFSSHVEIAARDVRVELSLPPGFEMPELHGDEQPRDPDEVRPQQLAAGGALVFHRRVESCAPELVSLDGEVRVEVSFEDPLTREPAGVEILTTLGDLLDEDPAPLLEGGAVLAYAEALQDLSELSGQAALDRIGQARAEVQAAAAALPNDAQLREIDELLEMYGDQF
ncbi:MAG: VWA domain-containing protein [Polyangia bacterium]